MTAVIGSLQYGLIQLTTWRSMIAVYENLTWEIFNFRGVFTKIGRHGWGLFLMLVGKRVVTIRSLQSGSTGVK